MKAVMVDGPKSGEVITFSSAEPTTDTLCFAITRPINLFNYSMDPHDPYMKPYDTAIYRSCGKVASRTGETIVVYTFEGMQ